MPTGAIERSEISTLLAEAKQLYAELQGDVATVEHHARRGVWRAYLIGRKLLEIRERIGKGNWLLWLEGNWTELSVRTAQLYMFIAHSNEDATCVDELDCDAIRKFNLGFVPEKERPGLAGDARLPKCVHHLSIANTWGKWHRELELGKVQASEDELRRDLKPMFEWMCELFGFNRQS